VVSGLFWGVFCCLKYCSEWHPSSSSVSKAGKLPYCLNCVLVTLNLTTKQIEYMASNSLLEDSVVFCLSVHRIETYCAMSQILPCAAFYLYHNNVMNWTCCWCLEISIVIYMDSNIKLYSIVFTANIVKVWSDYISVLADDGQMPVFEWLGKVKIFFYNSCFRFNCFWYCYIFINCCNRINYNSCILRMRLYDLPTDCFFW
jgi:hypothetical protein